MKNFKYYGTKILAVVLAGSMAGAISSCKLNPSWGTATSIVQTVDDVEEEINKAFPLLSNEMVKDTSIMLLLDKIAAKDEILATGEAQSPDFYKEYQSLKDQLEKKMEEWEEAVIAAEQ